MQRTPLIRFRTIGLSMLFIASAALVVITPASANFFVVWDDIGVSVTVNGELWIATPEHKAALEAATGLTAQTSTIEEMFDDLPDADSGMRVRIDGASFHADVVEELHEKGYVNSGSIPPLSGASVATRYSP